MILLRKTKTKNEIAWKELFKKYEILEKIEKKGKFEIEAEKIREIREPRLMTKFDHQKNLPKIFEENGLSLLPISRNKYLISYFNIFEKLEYDEDNIIKNISFPDFIHSININNITSETIALNSAFISGIFDDFLNETNFKPTVSGRMTTGTFQFKIKNTKTKKDNTIVVKNSQIEIDLALENKNTLILIEAKNSLSDDFLIRQIYYPYRTWKMRINKNIRTIFLQYSNGIFYLYEYKFNNPDDYNSIQLLNTKKYSLFLRKITFKDIERIYENIEILSITPEGIPFPQADKFERIINLCELLYNNLELTKEDITSNYDFDPRQTDYYTNAARYLGLIRKNRKNGEIIYSLTEVGKQLFLLDINERNLKFVELILQHKIFNRVFKIYLLNKEIPSKKKITEIMIELNTLKGQQSTLKRRAQTVINWIKWIINLIN